MTLSSGCFVVSVPQCSVFCIYSFILRPCSLNSGNRLYRATIFELNMHSFFFAPFFPSSKK